MHFGECDLWRQMQWFARIRLPFFLLIFKSKCDAFYIKYQGLPAGMVRCIFNSAQSSIGSQSFMVHHPVYGNGKYLQAVCHAALRQPTELPLHANVRRIFQTIQPWGDMIRQINVITERYTMHTHLYVYIFYWVGSWEKKGTFI